jgi:uncharacterized membrane protein
MEIFFYIGIVLFVIFGPWVLLWRVNARRRSDRLEDQARWSDITARVYTLERTLKEFRSQPASAGPAQAAHAETVVEAAPAPIAPAATAPPTPPSTPVKHAPPAPIPATPAIAEPVPTQTVAEAWVTRKTVEVPLRAPATTPTAPSQPPAPPPPAPVFAQPTAEPETPLFDRLKSALDIEEMLGTDWLNKLGIALLVLGIAFFLAYQLKTLGPMGKVLVGLVTAGVMLGAGIWVERGERYRILARAGIGGGWALFFFTTYAMYHVPAAQVLTSQSADLVLLLVVAAAMVGHTLRYRSQVVTGLAFLLAFLTVTISQSDVYSLSAGAVLAAGLVVIVGRMQWFELEVFGILASYFNHYMWLRPIIEPMRGHRHPFPEFAASAGILSLYWLIFRVSYVSRRPSDQRRERISTAAAFLNTGLLLALFKYQSTHPEWAFWALLAIGGIETALGQLPITRRRRSAVIVLSTLGIVLLVAAFPFRYSETRLSVLWLAEVEAVVLAGVWTKEVVFRRLGMIAAVVLAGQMISFDAAAIFGRRMDGADLRSDFGLAIIFVLAAAVFYAKAHWVFRRWSDLFVTEFDRVLVQRLSYVAGTMMLVAAWIAFPETWTAVAWCALGLGMAVIGRRLAISELTYQANCLAAASVIRVLVMNLDATEKFHGVTLRVVTVGLVAALLYVTSRWSWRSDSNSEVKFAGRVFSSGEIAGGAYTWAASFLLALLAWYELRPVNVALAWILGGLVLFELGLRVRKISLRLQSYVAFAASFLRILVVNLETSGLPGKISPRLYTVGPIAVVFYYAYWRLRQETGDQFEFESKLREGYSWVASFLLALLAWYELRPVGVADAWVVGGLVLLEFGLTRKNLGLRWQSYVALVASFVRIFFVNLNADGMPGEISPRFYSLVPIALAFFYAYWRLSASRDELSEKERRLRAAGLCCWLGTITIAALMRFELEADWVAAGWAALAFALLAVTWRRGQRVFLHQGLLVVFGVLFRTVMHNFYERNYFPSQSWQNTRWVTVGVAVVFLLAALPIAFQVRRKDEPSSERGFVRLVESLGRRPEQLFFFIAVGLLTVLLALEMRHGMVTLSWGVEGLGVFLLALWMGERSFRLTGLGLLLLCVGKILVDDVWRLNPRDRYLTFIVLGAALLLVSFLYTRFRETIRQYL